MCRILSAGRDHHLLAVRSLLLRAWGHSVTEAHSCAEALRLLGGVSTDVIVLCHTLSAEEHATLISEAHKRCSAPVICLIAREGDCYAKAVNSSNAPEALQEALESLGLQAAVLRGG